MKTYRWRSIGLVMLLSITCAIPAAAQDTSASQPALTLRASGAFRGGGDFAGTININRFEARGDDVVAVGFVAGVLSRGKRTVGTAVLGELEWPVIIKSGDIDIAHGRESQSVKPSLIAFSPSGGLGARYLLAQASCSVLDVSLAPINVDLLGFQVALGGVNLNIGGDPNLPIGALVCEASKLLGQVAKVVALLNNLLGLLTGLLGGLTGGLAA